MVFGSRKQMSREKVKTRRLDEDDGSKLETEDKIMEAEDRLSKLPDDILVHILSLLDDTKLAVQTSVLGKRWSNFWTLLSTLYFKFDISSTFKVHKPAGDFNELPTHFLMRRNQSAKLSHLTFICFRGLCLSQKVIDYLSIHSHNRHIQYLSVSRNFCPDMMKQLLPCLLTWESLTTLKLEGIAIPTGTTFDFVSLVTLELLGCRLMPSSDSSDSSDSKLEIPAPLLTHLKILRLINWHFELIISSPNLSSFCFLWDDCSSLDISSSSTFPSLQKVNLDIHQTGVYFFREWSWELTYGHVFKFFHIIGHAKNVTVSSRIIDFIFKALETSEGCASPFVGVETFKIEVQRRNMDGKPQPYAEPWPYIVPDNVLKYLLSASPSAQVLVEGIPSGEL